jgi:hypothetical protein
VIENMKIEDRNKAKANANLLLDDVKALKGEPRAFLEGMLTGLQMNKAQPAPAAKEPEKQEEVK